MPQIEIFVAQPLSQVLCRALGESCTCPQLQLPLVSSPDCRLQLLPPEGFKAEMFGSVGNKFTIFQKD